MEREIEKTGNQENLKQNVITSPRSHLSHPGLRGCNRSHADLMAPRHTLLGWCSFFRASAISSHHISGALTYSKHWMPLAVFCVASPLHSPRPDQNPQSASQTNHATARANEIEPRNHSLAVVPHLQPAPPKYRVGEGHLIACVVLSFVFVWSVNLLLSVSHSLFAGLKNFQAERYGACTMLTRHVAWSSIRRYGCPCARNVALPTL